jgi:hypothetical protein
VGAQINEAAGVQVVVDDVQEAVKAVGRVTGHRVEV